MVKFDLILLKRFFFLLKKLFIQIKIFQSEFHFKINLI